MIIEKQKMLLVEEATNYIKANLESLQDLFGLGHWEVNIRLYCNEDDNGDRGQVELQPEYERATIHMYLPAFEDLEGFEQTLKHELMHLVHSPFQKAQYLLEKILKDDALNILTEVFRQASEETVLNLNRMHKGHLNREGK